MYLVRDENLSWKCRVFLSVKFTNLHKHNLHNLTKHNLYKFIVLRRPYVRIEGRPPTREYAWQ